MSVRDVRYVCLSDLHLGEPDSILTPLQPDSHQVDPTAVGPLLEQLVISIERLVEDNVGDRRPILILNGDALELAFGTFSLALTNFERLAKLLLERELFEKLVYIPGNHDHHIWEVARETQYGNTVVGQPSEGVLPPLRHSTSLRLEEAVPAFLLNKIIDHVHPPDNVHEGEHEVLVTYPNLALVSADRSVIFHHGHYVEPLYHFFSTARRWLFPDRPRAESIDEIEAENFAWIEFVWSLLGRSGGAGADMRRLFRTLRDPEEFDEFAESLARRVVSRADIPWIPGDLLERMAIKKILEWVGPRLSGERSRRMVVQSREIREGIERYLFGPTYRQLREELGTVPADLTFVFGHTHKPFETVIPDPDGKEVKIYNSGGWPIDSREPSDAVGASIVLLNEDLHLAALRIYCDGAPEGRVLLEVRSAGEEAGGEFRDEVSARIRGADGRGAPVRERLAAHIHGAIRCRRRHHEQLSDRPA